MATINYKIMAYNVLKIEFCIPSFKSHIGISISAYWKHCSNTCFLIQYVDRTGFEVKNFWPYPCPLFCCQQSQLEYLQQHFQMCKLFHQGYSHCSSLIHILVKGRQGQQLKISAAAASPKTLILPKGNLHAPVCIN